MAILAELQKQVASIYKDIEDIDAKAKGKPNWFEKNLEMDTVEFLRELEKHGHVVAVVDFMDDDALEEYVRRSFRTNTCNNSEPWSHDMMIVQPADNTDPSYLESCYIAYAVHCEGDVRCNYTDFIVFNFKNHYDYVDTITEILSKKTAIVVDEDDHRHTIRWEGRESYSVENEDGELQLVELYFDDTEEEVIKKIHEVFYEN